MFSRLAAAIVRFFKSVGIDVWNGRWDFLRWCDDLVRAPFRTVFGHGPAQPSYTPEYQTADLIDTLKGARQEAAEKILRLDRDVIESVLEYCRAHRDDRARMRLPKTLDPRVRAALLSMDDTALRTLSKAGIGQVRRFVDAVPHGIPGLPSFGEHLPSVTDETPPKGMTAHEATLWKVRARLLKGGHSEPFTTPKMARP